MSATFDEWIRAAFDHPVSEREWYWGEDFGNFWEALCLTDDLSVAYLGSLFREPDRLRVYSLPQVAQGIWFLIGESSPGQTAYALFNDEVALEQRATCIRSIADFFRLFVATAAPDLADIDGDPFHIACFMWWDIFPTYGGGWKDGWDPELHTASLSTMAEILNLPSELCQLSALHGLNHWQPHHAEQVERIVNSFLMESTHLTARVREYSETARLGRAQ